MDMIKDLKELKEKSLGHYILLPMPPNGITKPRTNYTYWVNGTKITKTI